MSLRPKVRSSALVARLSRGSVLVDVSELHHRVSSVELQDVPAGEPPDHGDAKGVRISPTTHGFSQGGWDSYT